jgi:hypothetical protein
MNQLTLAIRQEAARILEENIVDVVIGFEAGTLPLRAQPAFITQKEEPEKLVLNGFCQNNLAAYLTRRPKEERIGIICRGCESRAVRALVIEHQHDRDRLYLIGVPCTGIIEWRKIERQVGENALQAVEEGNEVIVTTRDGEHRFQPRYSSLRPCCPRNATLISSRRPNAAFAVTPAGKRARCVIAPSALWTMPRRAGPKARSRPAARRHGTSSAPFTRRDVA